MSTPSIETHEDGMITVRFDGGMVNIHRTDEGVVIVDVFDHDGQDLIDSTWLDTEEGDLA